MKLKLNNIEIECTVDEFEEMVVRGLLDKDLKPEEFDELPKIQPVTPVTDNDQLNRQLKKWPPYDPNEMTITAYGCGMPSSINGGNIIGPTGDIIPGPQV